MSKPNAAVLLMKLTGGIKLGRGMKLGGKLSLKREPKVDPLANVIYTGNEEADTKAELNEMQLAFRARQKREKERVDRATDSEFWFCVCFHTREQKEQFLRLAKLIELGDKYLDGLEVAKCLNITLEK